MDRRGEMPISMTIRQTRTWFGRRPRKKGSIKRLNQERSACTFPYLNTDSMFPRVGSTLIRTRRTTAHPSRPCTAHQKRWCSSLRLCPTRRTASSRGRFSTPCCCAGSAPRCPRRRPPRSPRPAAPAAARAAAEKPPPRWWSSLLSITPPSLTVLYCTMLFACFFCMGFFLHLL